MWAMSVPVESLPPTARAACERLRDGLAELLGPHLVALWAFGAATFPERPRRLGDVDTYGILARAPGPATVEALKRLHRVVSRDLSVEWDSWFVLEADAGGSAPPAHAFTDGAVDRAWALHRAHWLAGRYVALYGRRPADLVRLPDSKEIEDGLGYELDFMRRLVGEGKDDPGEAAYVVWNACRILMTLELGDPAVSKLASARWALGHLPSAWHPAIEAAGRVYDGAPRPEDAKELAGCLLSMISLVQERMDSKA